MLGALPRARGLIADRGYDTDAFRAGLAGRGIAACIPSKKNRKAPIPHDAALYKQRQRIEVMFGRLKDWRRVGARYDRCAHTFFSAILVAVATIIATAISVAAKIALTAQDELNISAEIGIKMFVFMWIATILTVLAFILHAAMGCCCKPQRGNRSP